MDLQSLAIDEVWKYVCKKGNEHSGLIENMNSNYKFHLTDVENGTYYLMFSDKKVSVSQGEHVDVNCTLTMKRKHFISLLEGKLNATTAFMTGRLKVEGNIGHALKLEQLFKEISN